MNTLVERGVGETPYWSLIRWCDPSTSQKLADRGYILAKPPGRSLADDEISLTEKGLADWNAFAKSSRIFIR